MTNDDLTLIPGFHQLGLTRALLKSLKNEGYTQPTPIQAGIIPHILAGRDVVGQAQTGTGKTAAFALPLLNRLGKGSRRGVRILVLAPTRELALQVAEAFTRYGTHLPDLNILPIFGGEPYATQLARLRHGVDVVVGTPGRVMDHIRRGSLDLAAIETLVLDEADEMLKMGFIEDVEWIVAQTPEKRQVALFSATMPTSIRRIAATYLADPVEIAIGAKTATAATIEQSYLMVRGMRDKREVLGKILESEDTDGMLIFVRTKAQSVELAEYIADLGYNALALNGDIPQPQRLRLVEQLKAGKTDILVATDVAARGLDVERVSHVINFDIPFEAESYIHRIGRTGRAGRAGKAILLLTPRDKAMLKTIEKTTRQKIKPMTLPTAAEINRRRIARYKDQITLALAADCEVFETVISEYCRENDIPVARVAGALAKMAQGEKPLLLEVEPAPAKRNVRPRQAKQGKRAPENSRTTSRPEQGMQRYRLEVGEMDGVRPGNIVGAIANEADLASRYIGRIAIFDQFSTVDLPVGMPHDIQKILYKARINGKLMRLHREDQKGRGADVSPPRS